MNWYTFRESSSVILIFASLLNGNQLLKELVPIKKGGNSLILSLKSRPHVGPRKVIEESQQIFPFVKMGTVMMVQPYTLINVQTPLKEIIGQTD